MYQPCDGPAVYKNLSVSTATEVRVGATPLQERKLVTVQPIDGDVYFGYDNSVTTSTGTLIYQGTVYPIEVSDKLPVYVIAATGTVDVRITEVA